jgi:hypothetical protein
MERLCASDLRQLEAVRQRDPEDSLRLLRMARDMALALCILDQHKAAAPTCRFSPALVSYSTLPSSRTVKIRSGTLCQATSRIPAGIR